MHTLLCTLASVLLAQAQPQADRVFPEETWLTRLPEQVGLDAQALKAMSGYMGGRGCVVRHGYMVYTWGDATERGDVASACKPWYAHFVFLALEQHKLRSLDTKVDRYQPCLDEINADLGHKDRNITFRHLATQTSCYGVREAPGAAFDYNDWQMALLFDALFLGVYGTSYATVDDSVLHAMLTEPLGCEDEPTFFAFGADHHQGRYGISPRDFARFGWLYLNGGRWKDRQLLSRRYAHQAVTSPLPVSLPRTKGEQAEMCPQARSIGSQKVPDNQTDHEGGYSFLWWMNGINREGNRRWPHADSDVFAALGHRHGQRGIAVLPSLDIVVSWNDTRLGELPDEPVPLDEVLRLLGEAVQHPTSTD